MIDYAQYVSKISPEDFWNSTIKTPSGCIEWTKCRYKRGYGKLGIKVNRRSVTLLAHRVAYILHFGTLPNTLVVMHSCDNPPCVNPEHLQLGTYKDNNLDRVKKDRFVVITNQQVQEIVTRYNMNNTLTYELLAKEFGVTKSTIYNAVRGRTRKYTRDICLLPKFARISAANRRRTQHTDSAEILEKK